MAAKIEKALVTGPGCEGCPAPTENAAICLAQNYACKRDAPTGTWYVRVEGRIKWHVTRDEDGTVWTRAARVMEDAA